MVGAGGGGGSEGADGEGGVAGVVGLVGVVGVVRYHGGMPSLASCVVVCVLVWVGGGVRAQEGLRLTVVIENGDRERRDVPVSVLLEVGEELSAAARGELGGWVQGHTLPFPMSITNP